MSTDLRLKNSQLPPVIGVRIWHSGVLQVIRTTGDGFNGPMVNVKSKKITHLSKQSRRNLALLLNTCSVDFGGMITLTYPDYYPADGKLVKKHLNAFLTKMRRKYGKFHYVWAMEFQARGAPHFHVIVSLPEPSMNDRARCAKYWANIVTDDPVEWGKCFRVHNHKKGWEKVRKRNGAKRYLAKYALKPYQKDVPVEYQNVGRWWAASKGVKVPYPDSEGAASEGEIRELLSRLGHKVATWEILPKNIYGVHLTEV